MTDDLRTFYENNGVDYDAFLRRLMGKESLVKKYLNMFLSDSTYEELRQAVNEKNYENVLAKAHTLKGLALNINLIDLGDLSAELVAGLRLGETENIDLQFEKIQSEYERIFRELHE